MYFIDKNLKKKKKKKQKKPQIKILTKIHHRFCTRIRDARTR